MAPEAPFESRERESRLIMSGIQLPLMIVEKIN